MVGLLFQKLTGMNIRIDMFVILGMASFFAAAANTPISTLIIVSEMTAGYELLLPSMWVCAVAYLISRGWSLFSEQVPTRFDSPAHRGDFIIDILQGRSAVPVEVLDPTRVADVDEIVGTALYLASGASSYTTGQAIQVDGGVLP